MNPEKADESPVVRGLFLCETVITDARTGKVSLINTLDQFRCPTFPSEPMAFVVYAYLTDGVGEVDLTVEIEGLATLEPIYSYTARVRFLDRIAAMHFRLTVTTCSFPSPGAYQVVLYANGNPIAQNRITVVR